MKYLIKNTALFYKSKLHKIGSVIELSPNEAKNNPNLEPLKDYSIKDVMIDDEKNHEKKTAPQKPKVSKS